MYSAVNIPDFMIEIPDGRDPVVLQLTDTQIIDGAQSRPEQSAGDKITYATEKIKEYCYDYLTEIITETKPDFIIITGDLIYGKYDDNGSVLKAFIEFMDTFKFLGRRYLATMKTKVKWALIGNVNNWKMPNIVCLNKRN